MYCLHTVMQQKLSFWDVGLALLILGVCFGFVGSLHRSDRFLAEEGEGEVWERRGSYEEEEEG